MEIDLEIRDERFTPRKNGLIFVDKLNQKLPTGGVSIGEQIDPALLHQIVEKANDADTDPYGYDFAYRAGTRRLP